MWLCGAWKVTLTTLAGHSLNRYLLFIVMSCLVCHVMFVQGVVPELLTNREAHQCLEYEGVFLVVGGYGPAYI